MEDQHQPNTIDDLLLNIYVEEQIREDTAAYTAEKRLSLAEQVQQVVANITEVAEMQLRKEPSEVVAQARQRGQELSKYLISRLLGDTERYEMLIRNALQERQEQ